jgi:hypothetical protein
MKVIEASRKKASVTAAAGRPIPNRSHPHSPAVCTHSAPDSKLPLERQIAANIIPLHSLSLALVAELVDAYDSGSYPERGGGSTPLESTKPLPESRAIEVVILRPSETLDCARLVAALSSEACRASAIPIIR